jgi:hypothetical protein
MFIVLHCVVMSSCLSVNDVTHFNLIVFLIINFVTDRLGIFICKVVLFMFIDISMCIAL